MKKIGSVIFIFLSWCSLHAQSFPNLNASTGNKYEFPVDKDTNIYMFHGNRLEKTDKNFNTIWAYSYGNLQFSHILLSKTGCLFFIAGTYFGKIENNGTLTWCKNVATVPSSIATYTINSINSILLDRNNNLVITGNCNAAIQAQAIYLKTDTNGLALKLNLFSGALTWNFSIVRDSLGYYQFIGAGGALSMNPGGSLAYMSFSDVSNTVIRARQIDDHPNTNTWWGFHLVRSKFANSFYVHQITSNPYDNPLCILKCSSSGVANWRTDLKYMSVLYGASTNFIEGQTGDLFVQLNTCCGNPSQYSSIFKVDSNGICNGNGIELMHAGPGYSVSPYPGGFTPQNIFGNKFYMDIVTAYIPNNPLVIKEFNSSLTSTCGITSTCGVTYSVGYVGTHPSPTLQTISTYTINSTSVTPVATTFTVNGRGDYCTITDIEGNAQSNFLIFPNPTSTQLSIENIQYDNLVVTDIFGKIVLEQNYYASKISVQHLPKGLYFLQLRFGNNVYASKFIKE
jgi:hypothetical protein